MTFPELFIVFLSSPNPTLIRQVTSLKHFYKTPKNTDNESQARFIQSAKVKTPELPAEGLFFPIRRPKSKKEINWKGFLDDTKSW